MLITRPVVSIFLAAMMVLGMGAACGQDYPSKPIRVVTSGVGGRADVVARLLAQELTVPLRQPLVVDNRPFPEVIAAVATSDGYTLLATGGSFYLATLLQKMSYDPVRDFSPITLVETFPFVLVANSSVPVNSVADLIALAKARPGALNYGSGEIGGGNHLGPELLKSMAGVNIVRIAYKSGSQALNGLLGGEVQITFTPPAAAAPHLKSGKLRALAVTSAQPSALAPGLPTVAASGLPGYELVWVLDRKDVKEKYLSIGAEVVGGSPAQFAAKIKSEMAKWGKVLKDSGIRAE